MAATNCGSAIPSPSDAQAATFPRGITPLARRPVETGGVATHVERLQPNSWCRHDFQRWIVFVAFEPALAEITLWSPEDSQSTVCLRGGSILFVPPNWTMAMTWSRTADAIILLPQPGLVLRGFPNASLVQSTVVNLSECFAAVRTIVDVVLDLRAFSAMPNGTSDGRVAAGGAYLASLLLHAHSLLINGRFRAPENFARIATRMRAHLELHAKRRVPVGEIAKEIGISPRQLRRIVREETGKSPVEWVREEKARQIRRMLEAGKTLKAAVAEGGFSNIGHLHRAIKRVYGCSPRAFRLVTQA